MASSSLSSVQLSSLLKIRPRSANGPPVHHPLRLDRSSGPDRCSRHRRLLLLSPPLTPTRTTRKVTVTALIRAPLISPTDQWGTWTALLAASAFGIWSENTNVGKALSGAMVSTLVGLAASSVGIMVADAPAYKIVMDYLLPMAIPLLLFDADLRRVLSSTGTLLVAFLLGSVATTIGTVLAYLLVPMRSLGQDSWKIAAALMSRHIGGDGKLEGEQTVGNKLPVLQSATAVAVSFAICKASASITNHFGLQGCNLPCITAIVVILATIFPAQVGRLAPAGEAIAFIIMQVFFTVVGANCNIANVINTTPGVFAFSALQIAIHLAVILGVGRLLRIEKKLLLIASNANVGGPTTACGMATAKGWSSLIVPGILVGIFGIAIATFIGIGFGLFVLRFL